MKTTTTAILLLFGLLAFSQETYYRTKTVAVPTYTEASAGKQDTVVVDSVSINPHWFSVKMKNGTPVDSSYFTVNFPKAYFTLKKPVATDSLVINYLRYPDFLTKTYKQLDQKIIVPNNAQTQRLYSLSENNKTRNFTPLDGLETSGSISRGVTIGNNQNSVLNSELDLQITGKLSDKVSLRASIQDANIPLQESGYSQRLDEFDQVFVELYSDRWKIRAGDIDLQNTQSYFASFTKRVQGLSLWANLGKAQNTELFASGALVRGQFASSRFTAIEGNQGPYKLQGNNGELFVLIVSGSETVYVNGIALERGENKDYIIDYNAGEILFNSTFPITSEMRIRVDYQFTDRNYSRVVAYGGGTFKNDKWTLHASVYSENDAKNQPLQQNLSSEQVELLSQAGDDREQMTAPSATPTTYNENRILYRKEMVNGEEVFVFSNNPDDELFSVTFTNVGSNQGNYILASSNAINNIYEYVEPVGSMPQGNYEPVVQLIAPTKLQLAVVNVSYNPLEGTKIGLEVAGSKNDLNLFSSEGDDNNDGFAMKFTAEQALIKNDSTWNLNAFADADMVQKNFRNIQGLYNAEFGRDWNLDETYGSRLMGSYGNQTLASSGLKLFHHKKGLVNYQFQHLNLSDLGNGNRHLLSGNFRLKRWHLLSRSSLLSSETNQTHSTFSRTHNRITYSAKKQWVGGRFSAENNEQKTVQTDSLTPISQRFSAYELFTGYGDSTNVFVEVGYKFRVNDSIRNNRLQKVNTSNTYYMNSRLLKTANTKLNLYVNYRTLEHEADSLETEHSLNSRLQYSQLLFDRIVQWNTVFETLSGTLPQQDFTYVEVEAGQGAYTWIDYNGNGIQELEEFETAQFQDQGAYVRVLLPNQIYIKTHQNRLSQTLTLNPQPWAVSKSKSKRFWSHFYNQTSYLIDRKQPRSGNRFNLNPFDGGKDALGLQKNFRNVLFFNRGKQRFTTSYTYLNNHNRNTLSVGLIENNLKSHQFHFNHKMGLSWLLNLSAQFDKNESLSENFSSKNFNLEEVKLHPKLSYLLNDNTRFDVFYKHATKENTTGNLERLEQHTYGMSFAVSNQQQMAISGEVNYISNQFNGLANTPVSYQMMEGLQAGKNFTWHLLAQQKLTKFLDLNLSYNGRKTETSQVIHTGNVQLKAYF